MAVAVFYDTSSFYNDTITISVWQKHTLYVFSNVSLYKPAPHFCAAAASSLPRWRWSPFSFFLFLPDFLNSNGEQSIQTLLLILPLTLDLDFSLDDRV